MKRSRKALWRALLGLALLAAVLALADVGRVLARQRTGEGGNATLGDCVEVEIGQPDEADN